MPSYENAKRVAARHGLTLADLEGKVKCVYKSFMGNSYAAVYEHDVIALKHKLNAAKAAEARAAEVAKFGGEEGYAKEIARRDEAAKQMRAKQEKVTAQRALLFGVKKAFLALSDVPGVCVCVCVCLCT
jgi:hypothetical protein